MGAVKNSGVFKGASVNGKIVKGLAKNGVAFWKQETLHAHTVKILARATAIGATAPTNIANFDAYVRSMYDIWMAYCDVFFRFRGTGDVNFKRINLANPDGVLADFYGGYTLDISGIKGNGINAYVDTNLNPSLLVAGQKYQLNDASRGITVSVPHSGKNNTLDGCTISSRNLILAQIGVNMRINQGTTNVTGTFNFIGTGLKILNRTTSNDVNGINKDAQMVGTIVSLLIDNSNQLILNRAGTYGDAGVSSYFMGKSIPFATSQLIRTAENADMANLGLPQIA